MAVMTLARKQRGIGLLEVMLALVIAAIVLMMSVRYYTTASTDQKVSSSVNMVRDMFAALQNLAKQQNFTIGNNDDVQDLIDSGLLTAQYQKNPFRGTNETNTSIAGSTPIAVITMNNVPDLPCKRIAGRLQQTMSAATTDYTCGGSDAECVGCSDNTMIVHYPLF